MHERISKSLHRKCRGEGTRNKVYLHEVARDGLVDRGKQERP